MNSTIVHSEQSAVLVDPGVFPPELDRIAGFIQKENLRQIRVLLTHTHGDHISGWHAFQKNQTYVHSVVRNKSEAIRENDVRYLQGMYRKEGYEDLEKLAFPHPLTFLEDGEIVRADLIDFCFYHTPGHSIDMSVIIIPSEKLLLSGDMLIHTPVPFILHSIQQYRESLNKIRELIDPYELNHMIPGHGKPVNSQAEIYSRIDNEENYIEKLLTKGRECISKEKSDAEVNKILLDCFPDLSSLHSHQANVKTFIREQDSLVDLN
jgi:glyoxylase-like metal-dependent hydrolase (beta-lactamase superfamily II)